MTAFPPAEALLIAGLVVTVGLIGLCLNLQDERRSRMTALVALGVAVTIVAAGRRMGTSAGEVAAWVSAALVLPTLWRRRSPAADGFWTLSAGLTATAVVLALMWSSR